MSAERITSASEVSASDTQTRPMLALIEKWLPSHWKRHSTMAWRRLLALAMAASTELLPSSTPNSSPPSRARVSEARSRRDTARLIWHSSSSPAAWP